jgi:hypothetical protein
MIEGLEHQTNMTAGVHLSSLFNYNCTAEPNLIKFPKTCREGERERERERHQRDQSDRKREI